MRKQPAIGYVMLALTFLSSPLAKAEEGRPVTAADLSGKTICWTDGWRMTYAADGHYFGDRIGKPSPPPNDKHRVLLGSGVIQIDTGPAGARFKKNQQIVVLPDGQLQQTTFNGSAGNSNFYRWGKVCN